MICQKQELRLDIKVKDRNESKNVSKEKVGRLQGSASQGSGLCNQQEESQV
jgi:hypothetical protein